MAPLEAVPSGDGFFGFMRARQSAAAAFDQGTFVGEVLEDELGDVVFDVDGEVAHDGGLDDLGLVGEPLDQAGEHGKLRHSSAVAGFVQPVSGAGGEFDSDDNSAAGHVGSINDNAYISESTVRI